MNNPYVVKICHGKHDFRKLKILGGQERSHNERASKLTNCKRFAIGLDFANCIMFPLGIHSVRMRKQ